MPKKRLYDFKFKKGDVVVNDIGIKYKILDANESTGSYCIVEFGKKVQKWVSIIGVENNCKLDATLFEIFYDRQKDIP